MHLPPSISHRDPVLFQCPRAGIPLALSSLLMIVICMLTDVVASIALVLEEPEPDMMLQPPRSLKKDRLVDGKLVRGGHMSVLQPVALDFSPETGEIGSDVACSTTTGAHTMGKERSCTPPKRLFIPPPPLHVCTDLPCVLLHWGLGEHGRLRQLLLVSGRLATTTPRWGPAVHLPHLVAAIRQGRFRPSPGLPVAHRMAAVWGWGGGGGLGELC